MAETEMRAWRAIAEMARWSWRALTLASVLSLTACGPEWLTGGGGRSCALAATDAWRPGCATSHNIAALVDQPMDLRKPRRESSRDASRRAAVIETYRDAHGQTATATGGETRP